MEAATSYSSSSIARSSDAESSCMVGSSCEPVPLALARVDGTQLLLPFGLSLANDLSASSAHPARRSAREGDLRRWYRPRCRGGCTTAGPTRPRPHAGMFCPTRARVVFENFDGKNARRADLGGALHPPRRPHSGVRSESAARGSGRAGASNASQTPASRIRPAYSLTRSLVPPSLSRQLLAYSAAVRLSLVVHALRLARRCPLPRSLPDLPRFLQDAGGTTESFYIFGDFILLSNPSGSLILASQALLAVYHALSYGRSLGPLGKPVQQVARVAAAHRETALFAMGFLDIMAFLQLMLYALTGGAGIRAFVQSFIYLNLVKSRSASDSPETYASTLPVCHFAPVLSISLPLLLTGFSLARLRTARTILRFGMR